MALRCVYTDLDDTLLGPGASLFRNGEGRFTLLPARALEACHRTGCEVMLMSGRRRSQVAEDARLIGQTAYSFEIGGGLVIDGEENWLCDDFNPRGTRSPWELIEESGAPALLLGAFAGDLEPHAPWHLGRRSRTSFVAESTSTRRTRCWRPRATAGSGWWTTERSPAAGACITWFPPRPRSRRRSGRT